MMSRRTDHFVISRIAIACGQGLPSEEWLNQRLELFRDFAAPALNSQSDAGFTLLMLFDQAFRGDWARKYAELLDIPHEILFCTDWKAAVDARLASRRSPHLITTGLDSDDAVAVDFIEEIQGRIRPGRGLNFLDGIQLDLRTGSMVQRRKHSNPFLSMHSSSGEWVFKASGHKKVAGRYPVDNVGGALMWLQIVHGRNVSNEFGEEHPPISREKIEQRFVLPIGSTWGRASFRRAWILHALRSIEIESLFRRLSSGVRRLLS